MSCHKDIVEDRFKASTAAATARWKPRVKDLADVPSLANIAQRFSRGWVQSYLLQPKDLRPGLIPTMPRLEISVQDARDIAAYLQPQADPPPDTKHPGFAGADLGKGRALIDSKGCGSCGDKCFARTSSPP